MLLCYWCQSKCVSGLERSYVQATDSSAADRQSVLSDLNTQLILVIKIMSDCHGEPCRTKPAEPRSWLLLLLLHQQGLVTKP